MNSYSLHIARSSAIEARVRTSADPQGTGQACTGGAGGQDVDESATRRHCTQRSLETSGRLNVSMIVCNVTLGGCSTVLGNAADTQGPTCQPAMDLELIMHACQPHQPDSSITVFHVDFGVEGPIRAKMYGSVSHAMLRGELAPVRSK